jgi:hypothetical protein
VIPADDLAAELHVKLGNPRYAAPIFFVSYCPQLFLSASRSRLVGLCDYHLEIYLSHFSLIELRTAYAAPFHGKGPANFLAYISEITKSKATLYSNTIPVVQGSGTGKSKTMTMVGNSHSFIFSFLIVSSLARKFSHFQSAYARLRSDTRPPTTLLLNSL